MAGNLSVGDFAAVVSTYRAEAGSGYLEVLQGNVVEILAVGAGDESGWVYAKRKYERGGHEFQTLGWLPASQLSKTPNQVLAEIYASQAVRSWSAELDSAARKGYLAPVAFNEQLTVHSLGEPAGWAYVSRTSKPHQRGWVPIETVFATAPMRDHRGLNSHGAVPGASSHGGPPAYHARPERIPTLLRPTPDDSALLQHNEPVNILGSSEGWMQVRRRGGQEGWVRSNHIRWAPLPQEPASSQVRTGPETSREFEQAAGTGSSTSSSSEAPAPSPQAPLACVRPAPNPGCNLRKGDLQRRWRSMTEAEAVIDINATEDVRMGSRWQCFSNSWRELWFEFVVPREFCDPILQFADRDRTVMCEFAEKAVMLCKAAAMGDGDRYWKIARTSDLREVRNQGRSICPVKNQLWDTIVCSLAFEVVLQKFRKIPSIQGMLLGTGDTLIAESSRDQLWGVDLAQGDNSISTPSEWRGINLLGWALMEVRDVLRGLTPFDTTTT
mmetsp:Transcript_139328/g.253422  ORF Transcript_139328/g.253422 Transcript_139328/m.253422 type:complete len:497 (-) Transcript_139328:73-1563(-)